MRDSGRQKANRRRFAAAHAARSLGWSWVDLLLAWHLHIALGLGGADTGRLLCAFLAIGGLATFATGLLIGRLGADGPMVVRIQVPAAFATAAFLWSQFMVADVHAAIAAGIAFRMSYAVLDVAQNMLTSLLPADDADLARYARLRVALSALARCTVVLVFAVAPTAEAGISAGMTFVLGGIALAMAVSALSLHALEFPSRAASDMTRGMVAGRRGRLLPLLAGWTAAGMLLPTLQRLAIFTPAATDMALSALLLGGFYVGVMLGPVLHFPHDRLRPGIAAAAGALAMVVPLATPLSTIVHAGGAIVHGAAVSVIGVRLWAATARRAGDADGGVVFGSVIVTIHLSSAAGMLAFGHLIEEFEKGGANATLLAFLLTAAGAMLAGTVRISERTVPATA